MITRTHKGFSKKMVVGQYVEVQARCPKCEVIHTAKVKPPIEKFMPRLYCEMCKSSRHLREEGISYMKDKPAHRGAAA